MMLSQTLTSHPEENRRQHCPLYGCKRVYTDTVALESHIKDHDIPAESIPGKVLLCSSIGCSDSFPDMQQLMQHMRLHHKPNIFFLCESCRAKLRSHRGLLMHLHTCSKVSRAKMKTGQMQGPLAPEGPPGFPAAAGEDWSHEQAAPQGEAVAGHMQASSHSQQADGPPSDLRSSPLTDSQEPPSYQQLQNFSRSSLMIKDEDMLTPVPLQFDGQPENQGQFQAQFQPQGQFQAQPQFQAQHQGQFQAQHQAPPEHQGQTPAPPQGQFQAPPQHQGQFQAPPQHQGQFQAPPQHQGQFQAPPQHQGQTQAPPEHQGQIQAPPLPHSAPQAPTSSAAVWKKNQGPPGTSRILWEHTRGRYRCVQCSLVLPNRKAMTAHIHTEHQTPAEN